uniref:Uncharacterized protein n=12 Tax=Nymphaea colorata TaxID=210225 RepID=A0A5K1E1Z0_9MAGN
MGFKGDSLRAESAKRVTMMVQGTHIHD